MPNNGAIYTYASNAPWVTKTEFKQNSTIQATIDRAYESNRNLLASVENKWGATQVSKYTYVNDNLNRRTSVVREGSAFSTSPHYDAWGYNDRNELTTSDRYNNGVPGTTTNPDAALDRAYDYDPIGNRLTADEGTSTSFTYFRNALNQYTSILHSSPGVGQGLTYDADGNLTETFVSGDIDGDSDVDIDDFALLTSGYGATCSNPSPLTAAQFTRADIVADCVLDISDYAALLSYFGQSGGQSVQTSYVWDAENRLIRVEPAGTPVSGNQKVEFAYDYQGRRHRRAAIDPRRGPDQELPVLRAASGQSQARARHPESPAIATHRAALDGGAHDLVDTELPLALHPLEKAE